MNFAPTLTYLILHRPTMSLHPANRALERGILTLILTKYNFIIPIQIELYVLLVTGQRGSHLCRLKPVARNSLPESFYRCTTAFAAN